MSNTTVKRTQFGKRKVKAPVVPTVVALPEHEIEEMVELLATLNSDTKIYFGCDSVRFRKRGEWMARYATIMIIHMDGRRGCKLYSHISTERDFDVKKDRPKMRMMNEARKVCELYLQLIPFIDEFDVEIHLDISKDPTQGSSVAAQDAAGYVLGLTGIDDEQLKLKPDAFAASGGADWFAVHSSGHVHEM